MVLVMEIATSFDVEDDIRMPIYLSRTIGLKNKKLGILGVCLVFETKEQAIKRGFKESSLMEIENIKKEN